MPEEFEGLDLSVFEEVMGTMEEVSRRWHEASMNSSVWDEIPE